MGEVTFDFLDVRLFFPTCGSSGTLSTFGGPSPKKRRTTTWRIPVGACQSRWRIPVAMASWQKDSLAVQAAFCFGGEE